MTEPTHLPILYSFRRCPYAIRARLALRYTETTVELREVVLKNKPDEMLAASPKGTVPVLVLKDSGHVIDESLDIMSWALAKRDPDGWLDSDKATVDQLIATNDGEFKHWLDRYKYPEHFPDFGNDDPRENCYAILQQLDTRLTSQPFLIGDTISIADVALFPFVRQFAFVDREDFAISSCKALNNWLEKFLNSEIFQSVMNKYPAWKPGDAATIF